MIMIYKSGLNQSQYKRSYDFKGARINENITTYRLIISIDSWSGRHQLQYHSLPENQWS